MAAPLEPGRPGRSLVGRQVTVSPARMAELLATLTAVRFG